MSEGLQIKKWEMLAENPMCFVRSMCSEGFNSLSLTLVGNLGSYIEFYGVFFFPQKFIKLIISYSP